MHLCIAAGRFHDCSRKTPSKGFFDELRRFDYSVTWLSNDFFKPGNKAIDSLSYIKFRSALKVKFMSCSASIVKPRKDLLYSYWFVIKILNVSRLF